MQYALALERERHSLVARAIETAINDALEAAAIEVEAVGADLNLIEASLIAYRVRALKPKDMPRQTHQAPDTFKEGQLQPKQPSKRGK